MWIYRKRSLQESIVINFNEFKKNKDDNFILFQIIGKKEIFQSYNEPLPKIIESTSRLIITCNNKF